MSVPLSIHSLVALCRKEVGDKLDMGSLKVILNKDLWEKCKKARLRLRKEEADQLFRVESVKNTSTLKSVDNISLTSGEKKTAPVAGVMGSSSKSLASVKEVDTTAAKISLQPVLTGLKKAPCPPGVNLSPTVTSSPPIITPSPPIVTPSPTIITPSPPIITPSPPIMSSSLPIIPPSQPIVTPSLPTSTPSPPCITPSPPIITSSSTIITPSPPIVSPLSQIISPPPIGTPSTQVSTSIPLNVSPFVPSVTSPTVSQPSLVPHASGETHPELNLVTHEDISLNTLKLSDINPNVQATPVEAMEVSEKLVEKEVENFSTPDTPEIETKVVTSDLPDLLSTAPLNTSSKTVSKPAEVEETVDLTDQKKTSQSAGSEEIIDLTGPQKKLSLKEYQEKLRKENTAVPPHDDVKPFEDDDEIEVIGIKEGNAKSSRSGDPPEPPFKKEKPSTVQPQDLLDRRGSGDVVVEGAVKAPPPNPIMVFKHRVTDRVKVHLLDYYAKDAKDRQHKDGRMKEIKIRNDQEFMSHCRTFSKKFQAEILEAHVAINGSAEGIEMVDVREYGIGHHIDKFFSEIKIQL